MRTQACPQPGCNNRGDLKEIAPGILACSECQKEARDGKKLKSVAVTDLPMMNPVTDEKSSYLETIRNFATDEVKNKIVRRLIKSKALYYDFDQIINNDRWFSLMDLRSIALELKEKENGRGNSIRTGSETGTISATFGNDTRSSKGRRKVTRTEVVGKA